MNVERRIRDVFDRLYSRRLEISLARGDAKRFKKIVKGIDALEAAADRICQPLQPDTPPVVLGTPERVASLTEALVAIAIDKGAALLPRDSLTQHSPAEAENSPHSKKMPPALMSRIGPAMALPPVVSLAIHPEMAARCFSLRSSDICLASSSEVPFGCFPRSRLRQAGSGSPGSTMLCVGRAGPNEGLGRIFPEAHRSRDGDG